MLLGSWVALVGCGVAPAPTGRLARMAGTDPQAASSAAIAEAAPATVVQLPPVESDAVADDKAGAGPVASDAAPTTQPAPSGRTYTVDAMVGQVNGESVYAGEVLNPIDAQLRALRRSVGAREFMEQAARLVRGQLDQVVLDRLILAEAESKLNEEERYRLRMIMADIRAELVRRHGQGSEQLASAVLAEKTGFDLQQTLRRERQRLLIGTYQQRYLLPKIDVSRMDVEREYQTNAAVYRPRPTRTLRMIVVDEPAAAETVSRRLAEGEPFTDVASDAALNGYKPADAGLFAQALVDTEVFGEAQLNAAVAALGEGESAGPLTLADGRQAWLFVEALAQGEARSLQDVQIDIERKLRDRQVQVLTMQERRRLLAEGSYDPIARMQSQVMEVARDRYLAPR